MNDIKINKEELRIKYLQTRKELPNKKEKSKTIVTKIIETKEYQKAKVIALYKSLPSEVNLDDLFFYEISSNEKLIKSNFGILEPLPNEDKLVDKKQIDLVIVPGICFDKDKNRLGFGKGFYDRYLAHSSIYKIGICFHNQVLTDNTLPVNQFDIKMDKVMTESEEY